MTDKVVHELQKIAEERKMASLAFIEEAKSAVFASLAASSTDELIVSSFALIFDRSATQIQEATEELKQILDDKTLPAPVRRHEIENRGKTIHNALQTVSDLALKSRLADAPLPALVHPARSFDTIRPDIGGFELKTPKGTVDFGPWQMAIRERVFNTIKGVFKRHGGVTIETPVFELRDTLTGKYGEDSKLIYDLADQGGELCSLRYDLTVPFARFMASNRTIKTIKRYHIARVYRRDQPSINRGRYREFYQCDFDIAGQFDVMMPDAEVLKIATEILDELDIGPYVLKVNHRLLLDGMLELCGVPADQFRPICSAIDKLDKMTWEQVRDEMVNGKNLDPAAADRIKEFVVLSGKPKELLQKLVDEKRFEGSKNAQEALNQLATLFDYLEAYNISDKCVFDLSLARGLDYYTGLIFEGITLDKKIGVGSIAGGGRYDGLIGMFGKQAVPSVGFSVGVERVFTIIETKEKKKKKGEDTVRTSETQILVVSPDSGLVLERMKICQELWAAGIKAELVNKTNPKMKAQLSYADEHGIQGAVIVGASEFQQGLVAVKDLKNRSQANVPRASVVQAVLDLLSGSISSSSSSSSSSAPAAVAVAEVAPVVAVAEVAPAQE